MLSLQLNGEEVIKMSPAHLPFHTPARSGPFPWKIVDEETGTTVDHYTPHRPAKPKPITPYKGSWAEGLLRR